ncbi:MAG: hypothetical protein JWO90_1613, partial [Solirubrobacterales bacterium]|nr:hypothetical protein [Solirubrobacterales bacterium]
MPQPHPAVPQCPIRSTPSRRARIARRALVLAGTSFALTAAGASAEASTGGGAEAGAAP